MKTILAVLAVLTFLPLAAHAENYLGGSYARVRQSGGPFDGSNNGYKFFAGAYNNTVGLEGGYVNFQHLGSGDGPHADAWVSSLMLGFPISFLTPFGRAGLAVSRVGGTPITEEAKHYRFYWGGGVRIGRDKGFGLRAEFERYRLDSDHVDLLSAGLEYRF
ncbi:MAG TPA: outer membrane beta-barrel protein [Nevskiaceae bacterium]|nr:outer membrane beta-barrel protein [Nevskiaceae bacterium]